MAGHASTTNTWWKHFLRLRDVLLWSGTEELSEAVLLEVGGVNPPFTIKDCGQGAGENAGLLRRMKARRLPRVRGNGISELAASIDRICPMTGMVYDGK